MLAGAIAAIPLVVLAAGAGWTRRSGVAIVRNWAIWGWVVLFAVSTHHFVSRASPLEAAEGIPSIENLIEIAAYVVLGLLSLGWLTRQSQLRFTSRNSIVYAWPVLAILSTSWSVAPLFTLVRSFQLIVPLLLAVVLAHLIVPSDVVLDATPWRQTLTTLVRVIVVLTLIGFMTPEWPSERFTWPGVHPGTAGTIVGACLIILATGGPRFLFFSRPFYWVSLSLLAVAAYLSQTRSVVVAVLGAALIGMIVGEERVWRKRFVSLVLGGIAGWVLLSLAGELAVEYFARGADFATISSLNGRIPLWQVAIAELDTEGRLFFGYGYGSSRVVLSGATEFVAQTAHNAWVEILVGTGLFGVTALTLAIAQLVTKVFRGLRCFESRVRRVAACSLVYIVIIGGASEAFVTPGFLLGLYALITSLVLAGEQIGSTYWRSAKSRPRQRF